ncbi:unnamed protein product [Musa banksii]
MKIVPDHTWCHSSQSNAHISKQCETTQIDSGTVAS